MSKKIVIVESDAAFARRLKDDLSAHGFEAVDTLDGKGAFDICKRERPDLVVLAVELAAGQSGYLVCGKIKKDDDFKKVPIIIIGKDPEGFEGHKKLKTRAEEYLKKPFDAALLTEKVSGLLGVPYSAGNSALEDIDVQLDEAPKHDLRDDPDLKDVDDVFDGLMGEPIPPPPPAIIAAPAPVIDDLDEALSGLDVDSAPPPAPAPVAAAVESSIPVHTPSRPRPAPVPAVDDAELTSLRARITELEDQLGQFQSQVGDKDAELAALRSSAGGGKDTSALRDASLKKDKEILKLKQDLSAKDKELNDKETELLELKEKEAAFDAKRDEDQAELAKRDTQLKGLTQRLEQAAAEKKKTDQANAQAKDEARAATAQLGALQGEFEMAQSESAELRQLVEEFKAKVAEMHDQLEGGRDESRKFKSELDQVQRLLEETRAQFANEKTDLEGRIEASLAESAQLQSRIAELGDQAAKNEERVVRAYQKIKSDEKTREKTRKALQMAAQLLEEGDAGGLENGEQLPT